MSRAFAPSRLRAFTPLCLYVYNVLKIYQTLGGNDNAVGRSKRAVRASWLYVTSPLGDVTLNIGSQCSTLNEIFAPNSNFPTLARTSQAGPSCPYSCGASLSPPCHAARSGIYSYTVGVPPSGRERKRDRVPTRFFPRRPPNEHERENERDEHNECALLSFLLLLLSSERARSFLDTIDARSAGVRESRRPFAAEREVRRRRPRRRWRCRRFGGARARVCAAGRRAV